MDYSDIVAFRNRLFRLKHKRVILFNTADFYYLNTVKNNKTIGIIYKLFLIISIKNKHKLIYVSYNVNIQ